MCDAGAGFGRISKTLNVDEGQRAAQADGEVCTEAQQHENTCVARGLTGAPGNYHGNLKWMAGETQEVKLVKKGRAELAKDAASQAGQKLQRCSSNDGEPVEGR